MSKTLNNKSVAKNLILSAAIVLSSSAAAARPKSTIELLVAGDSWANFLCDDHGYQKTFDQLNIKNLKENGDCKSVSKNGVEAGEWMQSEEHQKLLGKLTKRNQIKFVHLSIGGNDLIARWNKYMNIEEEIQLFERNFLLVSSIVNAVVNQRNDVTVVLSGYDFPRFESGHPIVEFQQIFEHMGSPEPVELNAALIRYHQYLHRRFLTQENYMHRFFTIHHLGLMHFHDGIKDAGVAPGTTRNPKYISWLESPEDFGGDLNYMTNKKSMKKWFSIFYDAFHLNESGNQKLAEHTFTNIIQPVMGLPRRR